MFSANTWGTVYRGDDVNDYADPVDLDAPVDGLERVPMAITEQSRQVTDPESSEQRIVRYAIGRARGGLDIRTDDRIQDERTGTWWAVRSVSQKSFTFHGARTLSLDLRAV